MDSKGGSEIWLRKKGETKNLYPTDTSINNSNYAAVLKQIGLTNSTALRCRENLMKIRSFENIISLYIPRYFLKPRTV